MSDTLTARSQILDRLGALEAPHAIKIIYACESGSQAWGFPSADSDYDVRFIYVNQPDWYLSVEERRDVIEPAIDGKWDLSGWDLRKSLRLLRKCNCPLIEWLSSPIVYHQDDDAIAPLKNLVNSAFLPESACHHYLAMTKKRTDTILRGETVRLKAYFYALRATLCCRYIIDHLRPAPVRLGDLLHIYLPEGELREQVDRLLATKRNSEESDGVARLVVLDKFLQAEQANVEKHIPRNPPKLEMDLFNNAFRQTLSLVWNQP